MKLNKLFAALVLCGMASLAMAQEHRTGHGQQGQGGLAAHAQSAPGWDERAQNRHEGPGFEQRGGPGRCDHDTDDRRGPRMGGPGERGGMGMNGPGPRGPEERGGREHGGPGFGPGPEGRRGPGEEPRMDGRGPDRGRPGFDERGKPGGDGRDGPRFGGSGPEDRRGPGGEPRRDERGADGSQEND